MLDRGAIGVITVYGSEPFDKDHKRMIESAATLFVASVQATPAQTPSIKGTSKSGPGVSGSRHDAGRREGDAPSDPSGESKPRIH